MSNSDKQTYAIWADHTICLEHEMDEYQWMSDDVAFIEAVDEETALESYKKLFEC